MSRNAGFVSAAKRLLAVQVAGCVGAAAVTGWAAFEVRDMVRERDALAARVAQLEAVIPPQLLPPPPAAIENEAPPPPPDQAQPPVDSDPVVNKVGDTPDGTPPPPVPTVPCELRDGTGTRCPVPLVGADNGFCFDVQRRLAYCPGRDYPPDPDPVENKIDIPPPPPPPARECQSVERRPIVCVPPFRRTPVPGVCVDGNNRPVRCPPGTPRAPRDQPQTDPRQQQPQPINRR